MKGRKVKQAFSKGGHQWEGKHKEGGNEGEYGRYILYLHMRICKTETCQNCSKKRGKTRREMMEGVNLRYIISTYVNFTKYSPVIIC
jgi:hypothetical protein